MSSKKRSPQKPKTYASPSVALFDSDRAGATEQVDESIRTKVSVEVNGLVLKLYSDIADDFELFKLMVKVDRGDRAAELDAYEHLFGSELENIEATLKERHGYVRTTDVADFFWKALDALAKNSLGS